MMRTVPPRRSGAPLLLCPLLVLLGACSPSATWTDVDGANLTPAQAQQKMRAEQARNELASTLLAELTAALGRDGAAAAIAVCRDRAPAIAAEVGTRQGVEIGRTAQRLRNPANQPPAWANAHVASAATEPALLAGPDGQLGVLQPIRLLPQCVQCHGKPDELSAGVEAALAANYAADRATGFAPGDLRGWFWIEVPAEH